MKTPVRLLGSITVAILALAAVTLLAGRALADSITFSETYQDNTAAGVYSSTTDTGTFTGSLTVPGLSALSANDWSNMEVSVTSTPLVNAYTNDLFASDFDDVMSDAVNQAGFLSATSATFFLQADDTNGIPVNVVKFVFTRSGNTFTFTEQPLSPPSFDGPWSLFAYNFADYTGSLSSYAITDQVSVQVTLSDTATTFAQYDDVIKLLNLSMTNSITYDQDADELNHIRITGSGDFIAPVVTPVSPSTSITTTNGLFSLEVRATDSTGVTNVEFYWDGQDFGPGNPGSSNLWSQIYALAPGVNSFVAVAGASDFNAASNVVNVTYVNRQTNTNSIQFSEHLMDFYTVTNSSTTNFNFNQDVGVLTAALFVPGLASLSADTWSNLVFAFSFGDLDYSNSLTTADVLSPTSATFYTTFYYGTSSSATLEQLTLTRSGNTLLVFKRTGNPSYTTDNSPIIADFYEGMNGPIADQEPLSLMLLNGATLLPYTSISVPIYISGTDAENVDGNDRELDDIQISGHADFTPPTVQITAPISGQQLSNGLFTVTGKAGDNLAVSNVFYSLNHSAWTPANTTNNWTNWFVQVSLVPGPDTLAAYAMDNSGNVSPTNTVTIVYVVSALLTVATNGPGSITPNDNNALLQIGKNYTLTAAAKSGTGFAFTNWTGGTSQPLSVLTNKPTLEFAMVTNLILAANFVDTEAPVLRITNVLSGLNVSNASFTVTGTATDNVAVAAIRTQLNGTGWLSPTTFAGRNWSDTLTLLPGTNRFQACAVDAAGNVSPTNTVTIVYVVSALLTVATNGPGSITPNDNNALLQIGKNYTLTAAAKSGTGFAFTNWTGGTSQPLSVLTNKPTLEFAMVTNLILEANFVDVTAPALSITNLVSGQRITNSVFTVAGKAGDNVAVAAVWLQFNGGLWTNPVTANNWTNWTDPLDLLPGTNTLAVYAVDTAGNVSPTNKLAFSYVPAGVQFPIATTGQQIAASVAFTGSNYLAAILGDGVNASNVTAQLFSSTGALLGARLHTGRTGDVPGGMPVVVCGSNAELMVWQDNAGGTALPYGQLITNGALQAAAFPVSSHASSKSTFTPPGIAFGNGQFFVVWNDDRSGTYAVFGRLVAADGTLGPEIQISTGSDDQKHPAVAFDGTNFLVAWVNETGTSPAQWDIYAAFVSADTTVVGAPFQINQTSSPAENPLSVAFDGANYFVAWNRAVGSSPSVWDIYGCLVSPAGTITVGEFPVATGSGNQVLPQITFGQGDYLVLWGDQWYTSSNTVTARFFTTAGQPEGPAFAPYTGVGPNKPLLAGAAFDGARFALVGTLGTMTTSGQILSGQVYGTFVRALAAHDEFAPWLASKLVSAPPFQPLEFVRQAGALQLRLSAAAPTNGVVVIETSTDLVHWQIVQTNSLPAPGILFSLPVDAQPAKFIRARRLP